jgi:DNA-binding transcriptional ArsR family regulator
MKIDPYQGFAVHGLPQALKLLAEPSRLRILCSLGLDCRPVSDIIAMTGLEQTNASFHLRLLREAGLVRAERRGPFIYYCLPDPELLNILSELNAWLDTKQGVVAKAAAARRESGAPTTTRSVGADRVPKMKATLRRSKAAA